MGILAAVFCTTASARTFSAGVLEREERQESKREEREGGRGRTIDQEKGSERKSVCVRACECVCEREREREMERTPVTHRAKESKREKESKRDEREEGKRGKERPRERE